MLEPDCKSQGTREGPEREKERERERENGDRPERLTSELYSHRVTEAEYSLPGARGNLDTSEIASRLGYEKYGLLV